jgi:hypothetical protein
MGKLTRPALAVGGAHLSAAEGCLAVALLLMNAVVFALHFWQAAGFGINCGGRSGSDCEDGVGRAAGYLVRANLAVIWFPVCRNVWWLFSGTAGGRGRMSYEMQVSLHRWLGYSIVATMMLHLVVFWAKWLSGDDVMDTLSRKALPSAGGPAGKAPTCEGGQCYGICGNGGQRGLGPCGLAGLKDCCHTQFQDGQGSTWLPSTSQPACICPLSVCGGSCTVDGAAVATFEGATRGTINFYGELGWVFTLLMFLSGLHCCRRKHWDLFMVFHHLFVVVVIFGILHDNSLGLVMLPGLSVYTFDKIMRRRRTRSCEVVGAIMLSGSGHLDEKCVHLTLSYGDRQPPDLRPGQHVQLCVSALSGMQWHPYSIAAVKSSETGTFNHGPLSH